MTDEISADTELFVENVRHFLRVRQHSVTELAELAGMHRQQLSKILAGRHDITLTTASRIAEALGVHLFVMFRRQNSTSAA